MKLLIILSIFVMSASSMTKEEQMEMIKARLMECKVQEGATDKDVDVLMSGAKPPSKEAECIAACMAEKAGFYKNGKFIRESLVEKAKLLNGDEKLISLAKEITEECEPIISSFTDRCDFGVHFRECMHNGLLSRNLDMHALLS